MRKKTALAVFVLFFLAAFVGFPLWAQSEPSSSQQIGSSEISSSKIPEWLKRTSFGIYIETDQEPRYYLETVQPLYQSDDKVNTFFTHDRISSQDGRPSYSAGLGYRRLLFDEELLAGINTFFDYQDLHKHYRQGLGLEALTKIIELRANGYFALSPKRLIEEVGTSKTFERAVNGGDVELGLPVPYVPWVKLFGSYYRYDFRNFDDKSGWQQRIEFKPFQFSTINFITYDDNKGPREYRMEGRLTLAFDTFALRDILSALKLTKEPFTGKDLEDRTLDRVERNFNIQVEKWVETSGITVEIGRGT